MKKWEYCVFHKVIFNPRGYDKSTNGTVSFFVNGDDPPCVLFFSGEFERKIPLWVAQSKSEKNAYGYMQLIIENLIENDVISKEKYIPKIESVLSRDLGKNYGDFGLELEDQSILSKETIIILAKALLFYLLDEGWELMDREGLWLKRLKE